MSEVSPEHAVLIYQNGDKHRVVYALSPDSAKRPGEIHVASIDPALWIEALLNTKDKVGVITDLCT